MFHYICQFFFIVLIRLTDARKHFYFLKHTPECNDVVRYGIYKSELTVIQPMIEIGGTAKNIFKHPRQIPQVQGRFGRLSAQRLSSRKRNYSI